MREKRGNESRENNRDKKYGSKPYSGERRDAGVGKSYGEKKSFGGRTNKPYGNRDNKPTGGRKLYGEKKFFGDRDSKPYASRNAKPTGESKPFGEKKTFSARINKPYGGRDAKPTGDSKPYGEKRVVNDRDRKPYGIRDSKSAGGRKPFGDKGIFAEERTADPAYKNRNYIENPAVNKEAESDSFQLEGRNSVIEALKAERPIDTILVKKGESEGMLKVIIAMAKEKDIVVKDMTKEKLDELSHTGKHQGVIAFCAAHEYAEIDDMFVKAAEKNENPFIIVLDGITDPHNLGAIIRTANAVGAHGIIIPKRRAAGLTAVVGKTSAGALQYVPVARVVNITSALEDLKQKGLWIACADMDGTGLYSAPLTGAIGLVIGGEGNGVSRLVKEKCDFTVSIPMMGEIASLNASVAAAVVMYEVLRRRAASVTEK